MIGSSFLNFDLLFQRSGGNYRVHVSNSPAGQAVGEFRLPFAELELENFLLKIGRPFRGTRRVDIPELEAAKEFGGRLFQSLFEGDLRGCLRGSLDAADNADAGLRIRLHLNETPELNDLPWEFLYNRSLNRFLSLSRNTPIVRYLDLPVRIRPVAVKPPLRVLVMISTPYDFPQLEVEQEWQQLREAMVDLESKGLVAIERLENASLSALQRKLRQEKYHVFHFIGHGSFDRQAQDGVLILEEEQGRSRMVSGQYLGTLLSNHRPLRLAILNACEGARAAINDPFSGTAQSLVQQGIPAVIAMQFEITDSVAITFAHEFYGSVSDGEPIDAALTEARAAIFAQGGNVEWGTPVLYMRSPDGQIFDIGTASMESQIQRIPLSDELQQAVASPLAEIREAAVKVLSGLLTGVHTELALTAFETLTILARDENIQVSKVAREALNLPNNAVAAKGLNSYGLSVSDASATGPQTESEALVTIGERGIIEKYNTAAAKIFGYRPNEIIGKNVSVLMPSPDREQHDQYIDNYLKTGEMKAIGSRREVAGVRKDGTEFPMDISVTEIWQGDRRVFTAILQDITERKQAEKQLNKMVETATLDTKKITAQLAVIDELLQRGKELFAQKQYSEAVATLSGILKYDPKRKEVIELIAECERRLAKQRERKYSVEIKPTPAHLDPALQATKSKRRISFKLVAEIVIGAVILSALATLYLKPEIGRLSPPTSMPHSKDTLDSIKQQLRQAELQADTENTRRYASGILDSAKAIKTLANMAESKNEFAVAESLYVAAAAKFRRAEDSASFELRRIAAAAKDKAEAARAEAERVGANRSQLFDKGERALRLGIQELDLSNHEPALSHFKSAQGFFDDAVQEEKRLLIKAKAVEVERAALKSRAENAGESARSARTKAELVNAKNNAVRAYSLAVGKDSRGQEQLASANFSTAITLFGEATSLYDRAVDESNAYSAALRLYQMGEYSQGLTELTTVLSEPPYGGENDLARQLHKDMERDLEFRNRKLVEADQKLNQGDLTGALAALEDLPHRDRAFVDTVNMRDKIIRADKEAPWVISPEIKDYESGQAITIIATVKDNLSVRRVWLHYSREGDYGFAKEEMKPSQGGIYTYSIPPGYADGQQILYYFTTEDLNGNLGTLGSETEPRRLKCRKRPMQVAPVIP